MPLSHVPREVIEVFYAQTCSRRTCILKRSSRCCVHKELINKVTMEVERPISSWEDGSGLYGAASSTRRNHIEAVPSGKL